MTETKLLVKSMEERSLSLCVRTNEMRCAKTGTCIFSGNAGKWKVIQIEKGSTSGCEENKTGGVSYHLVILSIQMHQNHLPP